MKDNPNIYLLVKQAKEGDQKAFNALLNTYWKDVFRFQLNKCKDEDEAEDTTIKTFARAFDKIATYNEDYQFKTWLLTISNNIYIDHLRKKKTETISIYNSHKEVHKIIDEDPSPADQLIQEQNLVQLKAYIKQLKPHYQDVINMRYFLELSYKEISEKLDEFRENERDRFISYPLWFVELVKKSFPGRS